MLILLSDGASLASRQCATVLSRAGHQVEALCAEGLCLGRMTRHVRRVHRVPGIGADPFGWLEAALDIAARRHAEVLLPVQEQVAVMSLARDRIEAAGVRTAVPDFGALARVQDKVSAFGTLTEVGLPQPPAALATSRADLEAAGELPAFVKTPVGTASAGVVRVETRAELRQLAARYERDGVFGAGGVLVQQPVDGPLVMVQSVFAHGELVAFHACQRVREGTGGGASHKLGLDLPEAREQLAALGAALRWHGALSADVIRDRAARCSSTSTPGWSSRSTPWSRRRPGAGPGRGCAHGHVAAAAAGRPGLRTHQLLLAVLGAAQHGGRREIARELGNALARRGDYRGSREELTPGGGDLLAALPVVLIAAATLARPAAGRYFTGGGVGATRSPRRRGRRSRRPAPRSATSRERRRTNAGRAPRTVRQKIFCLLFVEGACVGGDVDGVLTEHVQRDDLQRALVGGGQHHRSRGALAVRAQPVRRGHAPPVPRHQAGEAELRHRRGQVIADAALMREELRGHHRADRVAAQVLGSGGAAPVPVEPGERIGSTWLELRAEHISVAHACSISTAAARAQDQRPS